MNNDFFEDIYSNNYYLKNILIICQLFRENLDNTFDSIFNRSHCLTILDWFSLCNCLVNISDQNKIIILQHGIHLDEIQFLNETLLNFITDHPTPNIVIQLIMTLVHKEGILANNSDDFIRAVTNLNLTKEDNVDDVAFEKLITVLITQLKPEEKTNIISDTPTNLSSQSVSQATIFSPHADKKRKETLAGGPETKKRRVDKGK